MNYLDIFLNNMQSTWQEKAGFMEESNKCQAQKEPAQHRKRKIDTQENGLAEPERVKSPEDLGLKTGGKASNLMHEVPRL